MNRLQKEKYVCDIAAYFEKHLLHALFADLSEHLLRERPPDPISALIARLRAGARQRIFVVGTPGCGVKRIALELAERLSATGVCLGDLLRKEVVKATPLGQDAVSSIADGRLVADEVVITLLQRSLAESSSDVIVVEGFPKNAAQARFLLREGVAGDRFLCLNFSRSRALGGLAQALRGGMSAAQPYLEAFSVHSAQAQEVLRGLFSHLNGEGPALIPRLLDVLRIDGGACSSAPVRVFCFAAESASAELSTALGAVLINGDRPLATEREAAAVLRARLGRPDVRRRGAVVHFSVMQADRVCELFEEGSPIAWILADQSTLSGRSAQRLQRLGRCICLSSSSPPEGELQEIVRNLLRPI